MFLAPCGHPGTPIFGQFVLCPQCDVKPKTGVAPVPPALLRMADVHFYDFTYTGNPFSNPPAYSVAVAWDDDKSHWLYVMTRSSQNFLPTKPMYFMDFCIIDTWTCVYRKPLKMDLSACTVHKLNQYLSPIPAIYV